jgi:predicted O-linked N-acetylglucosamine transferase (SPINDLY family)
MQNISAILQRAQAEHARGKLPAAIVLYQSVLQAEPRNFAANYFLAVALYQSGQLEKSVRFFDAAAAASPRRVEPHKDRGLVLLKLQDFAGAEASFAQAIRLDPRKADLLVNHGIALNKLGRVAESVENYRAALQLQPDMAEAHNNLANSLRTLGRPDEALVHFDRASALKPSYFEAWLSAANLLLEREEFAEALTRFDHAVKLDPRHADAQNGRARALRKLDRLEEAEAAVNRALAVDPQHAGALFTRATIRQAQDRIEESLADYDRSLVLAPDNAEVLVRKAGLLRREKRYDEAIKIYDEAIALAPDVSKAYYGAGRCFIEKREFNAAAMSFDAAIERRPDYVGNHFWRGQALMQIDYVDEALTSFEKCIELKPDFAHAHLALASIYSMKNRNEEALAALEIVRELVPDKDPNLGRRFIEKMRMCMWGDYREDLAEIIRQIEAGTALIDPLSGLHYLDSAALQRRCAELAIAGLEKSALPPSKPAVLTRDRRIVVGYYSGDFREHAMMMLISEVFELHDKERFKLVAFSMKKALSSPKRQRAMPNFEAFHDVDHMLDREIIDLSREENVHVAIDLMGHTRHNKGSVFLSGVAPIQVNKQGFPGTMGSPMMDYIIADPVLIPEEMRQHYLEKVAYLPNSYQPNDRKRQISDRIFTREEMGLPPEGFVFACFNANFKVSPDVFAIWMRILRETPGSVLWLLTYTPSVCKNLQAEATAHGVDPGRLVFAEPMLPHDHLARQRLADLFLDTLPYNAHTTASDALWAGLPVLTNMGETFASRVAASLLRAAGLPELITTSADDYEQLALRLFRDRTMLMGLRQKLAGNRLSCALFDSERYTRDLESLYAQMVDRHERGLAPDHLFA